MLPAREILKFNNVGDPHFTTLIHDNNYVWIKSPHQFPQHHNDCLSLPEIFLSAVITFDGKIKKSSEMLVTRWAWQAESEMSYGQRTIN